MAPADVFVKQGFNIGIVLLSSVEYSSRTVKWGVIRYVVKDPMMPLNLSAVAFFPREAAR